MNDTAVAIDYKRHILAGQRSRAGLDFQKWFRDFADYRVSGSNYDPKNPGRDNDDQKAVRAQNEALVHLRDLGADAVHIDAAMREMSIRYQNDEYIGLRVMPVATVSKRSDKYFKYDERAQQAVPSARMDARGQANEVRQGLSPDNYSVSDFGLQETVPMTEIGNADAPLDPLADANMLVNDLCGLNREIEIATVMTTSGNYGANTTAIAAGAEWNSADGGKPIQLIQKAVDALYSGSGASKVVGFTSVNVFRALSRHPQIRDLFKYTADGFATANQIAEYFGFDELVVGRARNDTANIGQTETIARIWPDSFGVVRVAMQPTIRSYGFATTFRHGPVESVQMFERLKGRGGSYVVRVEYSEDYKVVASRAGYLITNCFDAALP